MAAAGKAASAAETAWFGDVGGPVAAQLAVVGPMVAGLRLASPRGACPRAAGPRRWM